MPTNSTPPPEQTYYPHVNFHFKVTITGLASQPVDMQFQSISGLDVQVETESIKEGGVNEFEHVVPVRSKYSDLVLKRGKVLPGKPPPPNQPKDVSDIVHWCKNAVEKFLFDPKDITVTLLDEQHNPLMVWQVKHAYPKSWKMSELNADKGEVLIETLELAYNSFVFHPQ